MWKAIAISAMLAAPAMAQGNDNSDAVEVCTAMHGLAETIMEHRQTPGASVAESMRLAQGADELIRPVAEAFVMMAFDEPAWSSERVQRRAVAEFANRAFMMCMAAFGDKA